MSQNNDTNNLSKHLKAFEPYIGKAYKGEFVGSTSEKPVFDVQYWERILNGNGIRITHSVNDGKYGGVSIIMCDLQCESLRSWYFTTAGFYTEATVTFEDKKNVSREQVTGKPNGVTNVKSTVQLLLNGEMHTKTQYFQEGKWIDGHEIYYKEDPEADIIFK